MEVPEFVPEVAFLQCLAIGNVEMIKAGKGFQHREVRCAGFVEAGEQGVDCAQPSLWRDEQVCPAFTGMRCAFNIGDSFEGADDRGADSDDTFTS